MQGSSDILDVEGIAEPNSWLQNHLVDLMWIIFKQSRLNDVLLDEAHGLGNYKA